MDFEPGWLMRTCHEAHIDVMRDNSPAAVRHLGISSAKATDSDAAELYAKMDARFKAWTGRSLADFAALSR